MDEVYIPKDSFDQARIFLVAYNIQKICHNISIRGNDNMEYKTHTGHL